MEITSSRYQNVASQYKRATFAVAAHAALYSEEGESIHFFHVRRVRQTFAIFQPLRCHEKTQGKRRHLAVNERIARR